MGPDRTAEMCWKNPVTDIQLDTSDIIAAAVAKKGGSIVIGVKGYLLSAKLGVIGHHGQLIQRRSQAQVVRGKGRHREMEQFCVERLLLLLVDVASAYSTRCSPVHCQPLRVIGHG